MNTVALPTGDAAHLRRALRLDGWSTGTFGLLMLTAAFPLQDPLGLPAAVSMSVGVVVLGGALILLRLAGSGALAQRFAPAVIAVNGASVLGMLALAGSGVFPLTTAGVGFLAAGAVVVAVFAGLEYAGWRRMRVG